MSLKVQELEADVNDISNIPHGANIIVSPSKVSEFKHKNVRQRPRNKAKDDEIIQSMKKDGIRDQLKVWIEDGTDYLQLLGGYGRLEKAILLNIDVPCKVYRISEADAMRIHLQDNTQREDLSFIEEVNAAKTIYTLHNCDFETTRVELGWSKTKLRERLEIAKCCSKVKDLVDQGKLELGHAIVLAPYSVEVQEEKAKQIIDNNISVKALREIIGKVQLKLSDAKFDKTECAGCEFNTKDQLNLFGSIGDEERCRKSSCYKEKTTQWLQGIKDVAEEKYGKVIYLSQTDTKQVNMVSEKIMGSEQFRDGCSNCESKVAVMSDVPGREGLISENQCVDPICYKELTSPAKAATKQTKSTDEAEVTTAPSKVGEAKKTVFKPTAKLTQKNREQIRSAGGELFKQDGRTFAVMQTAALIQSSGYKPSEIKGYSFRDIVKHCITADKETLQRLGTEAFHHLISKTDTVAHANMIDVMIDLLKNAGQAGEDAVRMKWKMDKETLSMYTTQALLMICAQSGIEKKLEEKGTWKKVCKLKQADLIKVMVDTQPTSPLFAPNEYLMNIK